MALQTYGEAAPVPVEFEDIIKPNTKPSRFCRGRLLRGLPIGLIIYAGRNHFCHLDDEAPHQGDCIISPDGCVAPKFFIQRTQVLYRLKVWDRIWSQKRTISHMTVRKSNLFQIMISCNRPGRPTK